MLSVLHRPFAMTLVEVRDGETINLAGRFGMLRRSSGAADTTERSARRRIFREFRNLRTPTRWPTPRIPHRGIIWSSRVPSFPSEHTVVAEDLFVG